MKTLVVNNLDAHDTLELDTGYFEIDTFAQAVCGFQKDKDNCYVTNTGQLKGVLTYLRKCASPMHQSKNNYHKLGGKTLCIMQLESYLKKANAMNIEHEKTPENNQGKTKMKDEKTRKTRRKRQIYSKDYMKTIVKLSQEIGVPAAADNNNLARSSVYKWCKEYEEKTIDNKATKKELLTQANTGMPVNQAVLQDYENDSNTKLQDENNKLNEEIVFLKKMIDYFMIELKKE